MAREVEDADMAAPEAMETHGATESPVPTTNHVIMVSRVKEVTAAMLPGAVMKTKETILETPEMQGKAIETIADAVPENRHMILGNVTKAGPLVTGHVTTVPPRAVGAIPDCHRGLR